MGGGEILFSIYPIETLCSSIFQFRRGIFSS